MAVEDVLPALLLIGLIWLLIRYISRPSTVRSLPPDGITGVTPSMVETIHAAFPHIPPGNIIYSLSKTRSAQATSEEIIERGFLPAPPATFNIPPSLLPPTVDPTPASPSSATTPLSRPVPSLIERYHLASKLPSRKGKERDDGNGNVDPDPDVAVDSLSGPGQEVRATATTGTATAATSGRLSGPKWEDTREGRERGLRERKERMILEARRRLLEKQQQSAQGSNE